MPKPGPRTTSRYSDEFKATAVRLSEQPHVLVQDVATALYIHPFVLSRWRKRAREGKIMTKGVIVDPAVQAKRKRSAAWTRSSTMDEKQAEAAADAILEPGRKRQHEEQERSRARKARAALHRRRRRLARWFLLAGGVIGAVVAHFTGYPLSRGIIAGAIVGALVGWGVAYIKVRAGAN